MRVHPALKPAPPRVRPNFLRPLLAHPPHRALPQAQSSTGRLRRVPPRDRAGSPDAAAHGTTRPTAHCVPIRRVDADHRFRMRRESGPLSPPITNAERLVIAINSAMSVECPGRPRRCSAPLLLRAPLPPGARSTTTLYPRPTSLRDSAVALRRPAFGAPARARMHQHQRLCIRHHHMHPRLRLAIDRQRGNSGVGAIRGSGDYLRRLLDDVAARRHQTVEEGFAGPSRGSASPTSSASEALPISAERTAPCRSIARS